MATEPDDATDTGLPAGREAVIREEGARPDPVMGLRWHGDPAPLIAALTQAQSAFPELERSKQTKFTTDSGRTIEYWYVPLKELVEKITPRLNEHGLSLMQPVSEGPDGPVVRTILAHESGSMVEATLGVPPHDPTEPQELASGITYMRRYALSSLLGVSSETDDDGQAAQDADRAGDRSGNPRGSTQNTGKNGDKDSQRWEFHPQNGLNDSQTDRLQKLGWNNEDDEPHWWGYFSPQEITRQLDSLEALGEVMEG